MNIYLRFSKHCWQYPILVTLHEKARSSHPEVFCKKGVFENFAKEKVFSCEFSEIFKNNLFHRKPPLAASEKLKAEAVKKLFLKISQTKGVFSVNFAKFSRTHFFIKHIRLLLLKSEQQKHSSGSVL